MPLILIKVEDELHFSMKCTNSMISGIHFYLNTSNILSSFNNISDIEIFHLISQSNDYYVSKYCITVLMNSTSSDLY